MAASNRPASPSSSTPSSEGEYEFVQDQRKIRAELRAELEADFALAKAGLEIAHGTEKAHLQQELDGKNKLLIEQEAELETLRTTVAVELETALNAQRSQASTLEEQRRQIEKLQAALREEKEKTSALEIELAKEKRNTEALEKLRARARNNLLASVTPAPKPETGRLSPSPFS